MPQSRPSTSLYTRIRQILESARNRVARSVNTTQVVANWLIGREIVEEEQNGKHRADYGDRILVHLAGKLKRDFGDGYGLTNLKLCRKFFLIYPDLLASQKGHTVRDLSAPTSASTVSERASSTAAFGNVQRTVAQLPSRVSPNSSVS